MTQRIAVLSTDNNKGYQFYFPIVEKYWNHFGWEIALFYTSDCDIDELKGYSHSDTTTFHLIPDIPNVRTNTLAQTVRHFVADVLPLDSYWQVQDIDLIPLRPWNPGLGARTIWGYPEMTGGAFIPVHYTGMTGDKWYELMDCTGDLKADMERELKANGRAYAPQEDWEAWWNTDWDILTQKVLAKKELFTFLHREMVNGLPYGRVDRSTIKVHPESFEYSWITNYPELLDAHCENFNSSMPQKWANIRKLLVQVFGEIPDWMDKHAVEHYEKYGEH